MAGCLLDIVPTKILVKNDLTVENIAREKKIKIFKKIYSKIEIKKYRLIGTKLNRHGYFSFNFMCMCLYILRNNRIKK